MKKMTWWILSLVVVVLGMACAMSPHPWDPPPTALPSDALIPQTGACPAGWRYVILRVETHDRDDFLTAFPVDVTVDAIPASPQVPAHFWDASTESYHDFPYGGIHDNATLNIPFCFQPGVVVALSGTAYLTRQRWGDTVVTYFTDENGTELQNTRSFGTVLSADRNNPESYGDAYATSTFSTVGFK